MFSHIGGILVSIATLLSGISSNLSEVAKTPPATQKAQVYQSSIVSPELPRIYVDTTYPPLSTNRTIRYVKLSCSNVSNCYTTLQSAINEASLGDEILIDNNMTIQGPVVLKYKSSGSGWIIIRPSDMSFFPPEGSRISPSYSQYMPKIIAPGNNLSAVETEDRAHHYRLVGLEVTEGNNDDSNVLVQLGTGNSYCATPTDLYNVCDSSVLSMFASDIVLDRMYIHGQQNYGVKRGVGLDSKSSAIIDSYISNIHAVGQDAQAIAGIWGPGPYKIVNNYFEGSGENVLFGGDDPRVTDLIPSDIEFRGNYVYKPRTWRIGDSTYGGIHWAVKNLFELKNAQRILIQGNIFDGSWVDGQSGYAIVLTTRNQGGRCSWCVVQDVTFSNNIVRHASSGISVNGHDDHYPNNPVTNRIKIHNNLWEDISSANWGGSGWGILLDGGTSAPGPLNLEISNNTFLQDGTAVMAGSYYTPNVSTKPSTVLVNNIFAHNAYGIFGDTLGIGNPTLSAYFPNIIFLKNILVGGYPSLYSNYSGNYFPAGWGDVVADKNNGNYNVVSGSIYNNGGTDGKDIGVDLALLPSSTSNAVSSSGSANTPTITASASTTTQTTNSAPDTTAPTVVSFDVEPQTGTGAVVSSFSATDSGGSYLAKAELYRATLNSVNCNTTNKSGCYWELITTLNAPVGMSSWSANVQDAPVVGQYYYGVHVTDGANNYTVEPTPILITINPVTVTLPTPSTATTTTPITPSTGSMCVKITPYAPKKILRYGDNGERVRDLQNFLNEKCYVKSSDITGYFGDITRNALKNYQCDNNIVCSGTERTTGWGMLGPITREYIATHN